MQKLNYSKVIFREEDHTYWLGDMQLQGITGMLGRQLFPSKYDAVPEHVLKAAAERGSRIHSEIESFDLFGIPTSEESRWYADLKRKHGFEVVDSEYIVSDNKHFASAIDKVMEYNGEICLGDVKTTYSLDKEYISWQLSIYKYLFELQNPDIKVGKLYAIWVRNGAFLHEVDIIPSDIIKELLECEVKGIQFDNPFNKVATNENEKALALIKQITDIATQIEELKTLESEYKSQIEKLFKNLGVTKWETDYFVISKKNGYTKETFNAKKFKEDYPERYVSYVKKTEVKPTIITKLK